MREAEFQAQVIQLARLCGWMIFHTFDSRRSEAGYPDLTLVRRRLIFAELKTERGRLTPAQKKWIDALQDAGKDVRVWRPSDWKEIEAALI